MQALTVLKKNNKKSLKQKYSFVYLLGKFNDRILPNKFHEILSESHEARFCFSEIPM